MKDFRLDQKSQQLVAGCYERVAVALTPLDIMAAEGRERAAAIFV